MEVTRSWPVKHRPRKWSDISGCEPALLSLQGMLKRQSIPGAILYSGPAGCGKTTLARVFARYINCETNDACGKCASCMFPMDRHPDVTELNAAEKRGIDDVRALIQQSKFQPKHNMRVIIIDEAHQFTPQAMETMLKPLEEPSANTVYMICTTEPYKFKDTLLMRCAKITVGFPDKEQMAKRLRIIGKREKIEFDKAVIDACVDASMGHSRESISLLEQAANIMAADPKAKATEVVKSISGAADVEVQEAARKLLLGLYAESAITISKAVYDVTDMLGTINAAMYFNQYVMGTYIKSQSRQIWHSPHNREFKKRVDDKLPDLKLPAMLKAHARLTALRGVIHTVAGTELGLALTYLTGQA